MPTRNRAKDLRHGLRNALGQTGIQLELILSDNASTDETPLLCVKAASTDSRIRYFSQNKPLGLYEHHNFCLQKARGRYCAFFHDHDSHSPEFARRCVDFMEAHPHVGLVGTDWRMQDESGKNLGERRFKIPREEPGWRFIERTIRSGRSSVAIPGAIMRREAVGKHRLCGAKGFGDFPFWFRIAENWNVGHLPEVLWTMRQSTSSQSATTILQMTTDYLLNLEPYLEDVQRRHPQKTKWVCARKKEARKFVFWALVYEMILHLQSPGKIKAEKTLFQIYNYRLNKKQQKLLYARLRTFTPRGFYFAVRWLLSCSSKKVPSKVLSAFTLFPQFFRKILRLH